MKISNSIFGVFFSIFLLFSCGNSSEINTQTTSPNTTTKILPLGDSRVQGDRPNYESYRYELWKKLIVNQSHFDFVGPLKDPSTYPLFMNHSFDTDHSGVAGYTTTDILDNLDSFLTLSGTPDIVLLGIGGNDILKKVSAITTVNNIHTIIDVLQTKNPQIVIIVEQIAPSHTDFATAELTASFEQLNNNIITIAHEQTNEQSKVIVVDMNSQWKDTFMADALHYNEQGAKEIANRYFSELVNYLK